MDYKEKYEKAFSKATAAYKDEDRHLKATLERIFPELKESEDERIRKALIVYLRSILSNKKYGDKFIEDWIAWLEKQGEHANFRNKIQVGDKVTRNEDGVLVNLSQMKRVAKKDEKKGEQKPKRMVSAEAKEAMYDNSAWSGEDSTYYDDICETLINLIYSETAKINKNAVQKDLDWFTSLKERYTWKPSERQKEALLWCVVHLGGADKQTLGELLEALNKL